MIERYIVPTVGRYALRSIRTDHLNDFYTVLTATGGQHGVGLAAKTVHEVHLIVRSALTQTTEQGLTRSNVALRTQRPRPHARPRRGPETWTATELTTFLGTAGGHRLYPALHLTATTGMRRGEIAGLRWGDWNAASHQLSISSTRQALAGRSTEFATKTRTSRRCLELDANTGHVLEGWRDRQRNDGHRVGTHDSIFTNTGGGPLHPSRSASYSPGSLSVLACLTFGSTICATPMPACLSPPASLSRSCPNDSDTRIRRSRFTPTNTCCPA